MASNVTGWTAAEGEHRDTKKTKAVAVICQHRSREGLTKMLTAKVPGRKVLLG